MDLGLIFKTLWRHKFIMLAAILIGIWLAAEAGSRSFVTYETTIRLLVDTPGSDLVKVGQEPGEAAALGRTVALAGTYSYLVNSEPVLGRLTSEFGQIKELVQVGAIAGVPIIEVKVTGLWSKRVERLAGALAIAFQEYIAELQDTNDIKAENRIIIQPVGKPLPPVALKSRKIEIMIMMFLAAVSAGAVFAFVFDNLTAGRRPSDLIIGEEKAADSSEVG